MINVLIIDDSALVRKVLTETINSASDMNLVKAAFDPIFAIEILKKTQVDVIILDVEMPRMDGLTFLEKLMRAKPTTVIMLSSLTGKNSQITLNALELGAFEVLTKPDDIMDLPRMKEEILMAIRSGAASDVKNKLIKQYNEKTQGENQKSLKDRKELTVIGKTTDKVIVIGASTGGTTAINRILSNLPADIPGIVIVQHMPRRYTFAFAERLNKESRLHVKIAEDGERVLDGYAYLAPGERHCSVYSSGAKYYIRISDGPRINYHKPSVEPLFKSAAKYLGANAIGVMLTGMGDDGAEAMKDLKDSGSYNIIQDESSSVVWGMPGKAYELGAGNITLPIEKIAPHICDLLRKSQED